MISIMIDRNVGMVVAILAILKAGCAYVPVDPSFPPDRQSYIFNHSQSGCLIVDDDTYRTAQSLGVIFPPVIIIDSKSGRIKTALQEINNVIPEVTIRGSDVAYVLYTSGSTGKPKGVMVPHQGVVNIVNWFAYELELSFGSKVLGLTTFCFDISVLEMFMPLLHGGCLVVAASSTQKDPFRILEIIQEQNISVMQATPTTFEMMLATGWSGDDSIDFLVCKSNANFFPI